MRKIPKKRITVFMDRDGVINYEVDYLHRIEDLKILPRVSAAVRVLNQSKILVVVVTNQPVVAKGLVTEKEVIEINAKISEILKAENAKISAFFFCPHHPEANVQKYRIECNCRKPKTGLYEQAAKKFGIDLRKSYVIGDSFRDIKAGESLGCTTIFVKTGTNDLRDAKPDYFFEDLFEAVTFILKKGNLT